ncbi:MAG: hypothetical protein QM744_11365 [Mesorhizobium sp.]
MNAGSIRHLRVAFAGAPFWALVIAASAYTAPLLRGWQTQEHFARIVAMFGIGGLLAFPLGFYLAKRLAKQRRPEARFAAALLGFALATVAMTALLYVLDYRDYYSEWHEPPFTKIWFKELLVTAAAALYQFAALGMRLFFPVGFCALFAVAVWFVRLPH